MKFYQKNKGKPKQTKKIVEDHPFTHNSKVNNCCKKILEGKDIDKFWLHFGGKFIEYGEWLAEPRKAALFEGERILLRRIVGQNGFIATYVEGDYCNNSLLHTVKLKDKKYKTKYLLSILNSTLIGYYFLNYFARFEDVFPEVRIHELNSIPIKYIENQKPFIDLVDKILNITKDENYLQNPQKQAEVKEYEKQIDQLVYKLYGLTEEEIKIVEGMA